MDDMVDLKVVLILFFSIILILWIGGRKEGGNEKVSSSLIPRGETPDSDSCSLPCGGGKSYRTVSCVAKSGDSIVATAPDGRCDGGSRPESVEECNKEKC